MLAFRPARSHTWLVAFLAAVLGLSSCHHDTAKREKVGVAFETLQTEFWVASLEDIRSQLQSRQIDMRLAVADGDAYRQLEQVNSFIARRVDGMIVTPKDAQTIIPMIQAANQARIPIVLFNRPPATNDLKWVAVVADNYGIAKATVAYMVQVARKSPRKYKAIILMGDLSDLNGIKRWDGFEDAIREHGDMIEVVARIPTDWNQEKAQAGVVNAFQAHHDINFIFCSSDFLFPSVVSALKAVGKYRKIDEDGHVILGGFDGDKTACQMLAAGYLDADGVQDLRFEALAAVQAIADLKVGKPLSQIIPDPGFVINQDNLKEMRSRMWGCEITAPGSGPVVTSLLPRLSPERNLRRKVNGIPRS
jgi:ABC-type sugar transport system substrate-binding protein